MTEDERGLENIMNELADSVAEAPDADIIEEMKTEHAEELRQKLLDVVDRHKLEIIIKGYERAIRMAIEELEVPGYPHTAPMTCAIRILRRAQGGEK